MFIIAKFTTSVKGLMVVHNIDKNKRTLVESSVIADISFDLDYAVVPLMQLII